MCNMCKPSQVLLDATNPQGRSILVLNLSDCISYITHIRLHGREVVFGSKMCELNKSLGSYFWINSSSIQHKNWQHTSSMTYNQHIKLNLQSNSCNYSCFKCSQSIGLNFLTRHSSWTSPFSRTQGMEMYQDWSLKSVPLVKELDLNGVHPPKST
jgi:hypothetical protein